MIDINDFYAQSEIENILLEMEREFIGLKEVKCRVKEISSMLFFDKIREIYNLPKLNMSLHMSFTGRSGTGKTAIAEKLALILRNLGYLAKGHILNVTREDLVGQYIGHTAPKTKEQLQKANGGILFIDEAYQLYKVDNEKDYGAEAIELLLQVMENQHNNLIIIFAGHKDKIENFFTSNPGISSRIGNYIHFQDYELKDLIEIFKFLLEKKNRYKYSPEIIKLFIFYFEQLIKFSTFANIRTLKIFIQQILSYQANRIENLLYNNNILTFEDLVTITKSDFDCLTKEDFINVMNCENILLY